MANIGYIQVNRHCNNSCHFCSNPSNGQNITYEEGIKIIDDFLVSGYKWIIFTGGEPTLSLDLPKWISYAKEKWIESRMISNGMMTANFDFTKKLSDAWLELVHFSVYSYNPKIHDFLTNTPGSWKKLMLSIQNASSLGIRVQINTVISHYNQSHLDITVQFLMKQFPQIEHFVWNNLDPLMMRKTEVALSTLPDFSLFELPLRRSMQLLISLWKTFRVERVPLCYMRGFEYFSTETRKIVKKEERRIHFLDERWVAEQPTSWFLHDKWEACKKCDLNDICGGIWLHQPHHILGEDHPGYYDFVEYRPQKVSSEEKQNIIDTISYWK